METAVGEIKRIKFGRIRIKNWQVALIDLNHVNDIYKRYHPVQIVGLIGGDILSKYHAVINYELREITLDDKGV